MLSNKNWCANFVNKGSQMHSRKDKGKTSRLADLWIGTVSKSLLGYTLQYSWGSLVAQLVKNPPAVQKAWVQSLGWEYPLEEGMATHSSILAWRIPCTEESGGWWATVHEVTKSRHDWATKRSTVTLQQTSASFWPQAFLLAELCTARLLAEGTWS